MSESALSPRENPKKRDIFLLLACTMTILAGAALAPALPGIKQAFIETKDIDLWVKMILSLPGLVIALSAPLFGWFLDKRRKIPVLALSLIFYGLAGFSGYVFQDSLVLILAGRIGLGLAVAGIMVSATTLAGEYHVGPALGHFMGLRAAFASFGGVIFIALSGVLADIHWTSAFLIYLSAFIVLPGVLYYCKEPKKLGKTPPKNQMQLPSNIKSKILLCYILGFFEVFFMFMIPLHLPFYLKDLGSLNPTYIGLIIAATMLVVAFVSLNYRHFSQLFSHHKIHGCGFLLTATGFVILGLTSRLELALVGLLVLAFGLGAMRPNLTVWLFSFISPAIRARVVGGITTSYFLAQFIAPVFSQPLINSLGISMSFVVGGALCGLIGLGVLTLLPNSLSASHDVKIKSPS